jgi:hypothetical protein
MTQAIVPSAGLTWNVTADDGARFRPTNLTSGLQAPAYCWQREPGTTDLGSGRRARCALSAPGTHQPQVVALHTSAGELQEASVKAGNERFDGCRICR